MAKVAHISDIHFPVLSVGQSGWRRRWEKVTALLRQEKPDFIIVTGDVIDSARPQWLASKRIEAILTEELPQAFDPIPFVVVPGNHDIKTIQGLGRRDDVFASLFARLTRDKGGWHAPINDRVHLFTIDSNHSSWFARGRILERDLEKAVIPAECADKHLHVFALHHSILVEPTRTGESAVTTSERTLGLDDPAGLLGTIARNGFDIVLHGHRHLSTFQWYADPRADRRSRACLLIGAPSATKENWQGFNFIQDDESGAFEVHAVQQSQGAWLESHLVASRDYEETRTRRWKRQIEPNTQLSCDVIDVSISSYQEGSPAEKEAQLLAGDIKVEVVLQRPVHLGDKLEFPLASIVGYKGILWRDLSAWWTDFDGQERSLRVNKDGTIDVSNVRRPHSIRTTAVLLNAVPSAGGDWDRMQVSQPTLQDVIDVRLAMPARYLRLRVDIARLESLQTVARHPISLDHLTSETEFTAVYSDLSATDRCRQEIMAFRPLSGVGYCLTSSGDPVRGATTRSIPPGADVLQKKLADLRKLPPDIKVKIQRKLDELREKIIALSRKLPGAKGTDSDISADLLSIATKEEEGGGLRVEMTDMTSAARFEKKGLPSAVNIAFPWGQGVAGRALRLQKWQTWRRHKYDQRWHFSAWPANDCYVPVPKHGEHTYIYCGPLFTSEDDKTYMVGMLSFAAQTESSLLKHVIAAAQDPEKFHAFIDDFNDAVGKFSVWLGVAILDEDN